MQDNCLHKEYTRILGISVTVAKWGIRIRSLVGQKQHSDEQKRNHPRADLDLLEIAAETADDDVGNETKGNAKGDIVGKGHNCQRKECGHTDLEIGPVSFFRIGHIIACLSHFYTMNLINFRRTCFL